MFFYYSPPVKNRLLTLYYNHIPLNTIVFPLLYIDYSKENAYQVALEDKARIYEIKTSEKIDGELGFWWCGRFAMHKWGMD